MSAIENRSTDTSFFGNSTASNGLEVVSRTFRRARVTEETVLFESHLPIRGAGDGRLEFDQPYMPIQLAISRNKEINKDQTTVGEEIASNLVDLLQLQSGQTVVDMGTGPGIIAAHLSRYLGETGWIYCLDASPSMLAYAKTTLIGSNATLIHGDIHTADRLIPEKVDAAVLCGNVHLLTDRKVAFKAIWNTLKPSGKLAIVTHAYYNPRKDTNKFATKVDELSETRPDLKVGGLRLPLVSQKELRDIIKTAQDAGFAVQKREAETNAPDVNDVFGQGVVPQRTVAKRLILIEPGVNMDTAQNIAQDVLTVVYEGSQMQVYLLCTKQDQFLLPKQI